MTREACTAAMRAARSALAFMCCIALALTGVNATALSAFAANDAKTTGTYTAGNGWVLDYEIIDQTACISGVETEGSGELKIPSSIDDTMVGALGKNCFLDCTALTSIQIPETVTILQSSAFCGTGLTSVTLPKSVTALPYRCFKNCKSLTKVTFEGSTILYLGQEAFMNCSALPSISVPEITSYPRISSEADTSLTAGLEPFGDSCGVGKSCFAQCTSLTTIEYLGNVGHTTPNYFLDISCFNGDAALETFIWHTKRDDTGNSVGMPGLKIGNWYYSLDFYNSKDDADAYKNKVASVQYKPQMPSDTINKVKIFDLLNGGEASYADYKLNACTDSVPTPPSGKAWGVADQALLGDFTTLSDSFQVIAVDPDDLDYGWVSSPTIYKYFKAIEESGITRNALGSTSRPTFYLQKDGSIPDIDNVIAYGPNGKEPSQDSYRLVWEKANLTTTTSSANPQISSWTETSAKPSTEGIYRVHAVSSDGKHETATVEFSVATHTPTVHQYNAKSLLDSWGSLSSDVAGTLNGAAEYNVIAPSSDWRLQLISAGLAGAGKGLVLLDGKSSVSTEAWRATKLTGAQSVQVVGDLATVPQSTNVEDGKYLSDWLISNLAGWQTRYKSYTNASDLANKVYTTVAKKYFESSWGKTAIIASGTAGFRTMPIAELAYREGAPVFLTTSSGDLSSADLSSLKTGGFEKVVIAGSTSEISSSTESKVKAATGLSPQRVLNASGNACKNSIEFAKHLVDNGCSYSTVAIADGSNLANVCEAAQIAGIKDGIVLVCNSSADIKAVESLLASIIAGQGTNAVSDLFFVGSFNTSDPSIASHVSSLWASGSMTGVAKGDTIEANGVLYKLTGGSYAQLVGIVDSSLTSLSVGTFSYEGTTYHVSSIAAKAFSGTALKTLSFGTDVTSFASGAFSGASNLTSVAIKSTKVDKVASSMFSGLSKLTSVSFAKSPTSIGSKAFYHCTSLSSIPVSTSALTSIDSSAFEGCTKLSKVSIASKQLKSIGASTFAGCAKVSTASFSSSRLSSIGASAFAGCTKLSKASFTSKQLKKVGARSFYNCKALKTLTLKTKKLKKSGVGSKAFKGVSKKATVKVPASKVKSYTKILRAKGLSKKAKVKKG